MLFTVHTCIYACVVESDLLALVHVGRVSIKKITVHLYTSLRVLRSMDRQELYFPRTRTTMAMSRSFAVIAPSLWNRLPPSARASLLSSNLSTSLSLLKT